MGITCLDILAAPASAPGKHIVLLGDSHVEHLPMNGQVPTPYDNPAIVAPNGQPLGSQLAAAEKASMAAMLSFIRSVPNASCLLECGECSWSDENIKNDVAKGVCGGLHSIPINLQQDKGKLAKIVSCDVRQSDEVPTIHAWKAMSVTGQAGDLTVNDVDLVLEKCIAMAEKDKSINDGLLPNMAKYVVPLQQTFTQALQGDFAPPAQGRNAQIADVISSGNAKWKFDFNNELHLKLFQWLYDIGVLDKLPEELATTDTVILFAGDIHCRHMKMILQDMGWTEDLNAVQAWGDSAEYDAMKQAVEGKMSLVKFIDGKLFKWDGSVIAVE